MENPLPHSRPIFLLVACGLFGCSDESGSNASSAGSLIAGQSALDATPDDPPDALALYVPPTEDETFRCVAGERTCYSAATSLRCDPSGEGYAVETCEAGKACDDPSGLCRLQVCAPGEQVCVDERLYRRCRDSGTGFEDDLLACPDAKRCVHGACLYCTPNQPFCIQSDATALCDAEGDGYRNPSKCEGTDRCSEVTGVCEPVTCKPHKSECVGPASYRYCLASGTGFQQETSTCASGQLCVDGQCVFAPCIPTVMLLVDASASMAAKWPQVRSSVVDLVEVNPKALFGLTFFPTNAGCKTTTTPDVPVGPNAPETLGSWFDSHPAIGGTPLASAMNDMVLGAEANFGHYGGALVLLSDGENACGDDDWSDDTGAAAAARSLYQDFGVRTYVIGFGFKGNEQQLEAIAAQGGTGMSTFVKAGDEQALANALGAVIDDFKSCISTHP